MTKTNKKPEQELAVIPPAELEELRNLTGESLEPRRERFPRLTFSSYSKDLAKSAKQEGKDEQEHAGVFSITEPDESGDWKMSKVGREVEITVLLERRKLQYFDASDGSFVSSAEFDSPEETVPLFSKGSVVARGTVDELKARYAVTDEGTGKVGSKLKDHKVLYCLYNDKIVTFDLSSTNLFSFIKYKRSIPKHLSVSVLKTKVTNHIEEKGAQKWVLCDFETVGSIDYKFALEQVRALRSKFITEAALFGGNQTMLQAGDDNTKLSDLKLVDTAEE